MTVSGNSRNYSPETDRRNLRPKSTEWKREREKEKEIQRGSNIDRVTNGWSETRLAYWCNQDKFWKVYNQRNASSKKKIVKNVLKEKKQKKQKKETKNKTKQNKTKKTKKKKRIHTNGRIYSNQNLKEARF